MSTTGTNGEWQHTACVLCSLNCGLLVKIEDNTIAKVKGDKANPFSQGYTCSKGLTIAKYAHHKQRVLQPLKKQADGTHAPIAWEQAYAEIADKLNGIIAAHGGGAIGLAGGGGQGNHLDLPYATSFLRAIDSPWFFNALAQEYTHKFWVHRHTFGGDGVDYHVEPEHGEVLLVIGSNPYMSHGFQRTRVVLKAIAKDPDRALIVVDPRRHETAKLADRYLQIRPGTDVYFLLALVHVIVHEGLVDEASMTAHTTGWADMRYLADLVTPERAAGLCDLDADDIRWVARRFAAAASASIRVDLGLHHNKFSVENVYLVDLLHVLTGNLCRDGGAVFPASFFSGAGVTGGGGRRERPSTRVAGIPQILGMYPPNALPEEILDAGEAGLRALFVEGANPLRSYADSTRMEEAFRALDLLVVIDPAMTEAAHMADYVLPPPCGYEKWETVVFTKGYPGIYAHVRPPVLEAPPETRQEGIIFYQLLKAMGRDVSGHPLFGALELAIDAGEEAPVLSLVRGAATSFSMTRYQELLDAGTITADGNAPEQVFQAILDHPEGVELCKVDAANNWESLRTPDKKVILNPPPLVEVFAALEIPDDTDFRQNAEFPLVLQTGERSDYSANTIHRDPSWRKKFTSQLRMHETVAEELSITDGETVKLITEYAEALVPARVTDDIYPGNVSLPHGYGLLWEDEDTGKLEPVGVNVQALISAKHREPISGVPYHKHIPCRLEKVNGSQA